MNKYSLIKWFLVMGWMLCCDDDFIFIFLCLIVYMLMCNDDLSSILCKDCIKLSICMICLCGKFFCLNDRILWIVNNIVVVCVEYFMMWIIIILLF